MKKNLTPSGFSVRLERERRKWTQAELAKKLGMLRPDVSKLENSQAISPSRMLQLDEIFGGQKWRQHPGEYGSTPSGGESTVSDASTADRLILDQLGQLRMMLEDNARRIDAHDRIIKAMLKRRPLQEAKGKGETETGRG